MNTRLSPDELARYQGDGCLHPIRIMSDERRIGLTIQYAATSVRQTVTDKESATLVRGVDEYGHFHPEPVIDSDFSAEGVVFQERAEGIKHEVYENA